MSNDETISNSFEALLAVVLIVLKLVVIYFTIWGGAGDRLMQKFYVDMIGSGRRPPLAASRRLSRVLSLGLPSKVS